MILTRRNFIKRIGIATGLILLNPIELIEQVSTTFYSFPPAPAWGKSLAEIIEDELERVYRDLRRDMNRQLFGDGFNLKNIDNNHLGLLKRLSWLNEYNPKNI